MLIKMPTFLLTYTYFLLVYKLNEKIDSATHLFTQTKHFDQLTIKSLNLSALLYKRQCS